MPSFYAGPVAQQLPPTPPDFYGAYIDSFNGPGRFTAMPSVGRYDSFPHYEKEPQELPTAAKNILPPPASMSRNMYGADRPIQCSSFPMVSTSSARSAYGPVTAPIPPSVGIPNGVAPAVSKQIKSKSESSVTQVKEEKIGGVAMHLDYEMDEMVDFVSEKAQGIIVNSKSPIHPDFRKFVSQVLSSTRLPSSTILVGLHYLAERMTLLSASGKYGRGNGEMYHMLVTALLLGSKFMDDNTFQNRSWSEVSNIPVSDLNILETEWLLDINWNMHINPHDPRGFLLWHTLWERFKANKLDMSLSKSLQQTHIDENRRQQTMQQPLPSISGFATMYPHDRSGFSSGDRLRSCWDASRYHQWTASCTQTGYSPPSAPETGPSTPNSYGVLDSLGYRLQQTYPSAKIPSSIQAPHSNLPQAVYVRPYNQQYSHYNHANHCGCNYCLSHPENYHSMSGYCPQAVAG